MRGGSPIWHFAGCAPKRLQLEPRVPQHIKKSHKPPRLPHLFLNFEHRINTQLQQTTELAGGYDRLKSPFAAQKGRKPYQGGERGAPSYDVVRIFKAIFPSHSWVPLMLWPRAGSNSCGQAGCGGRSDALGAVCPLSSHLRLSAIRAMGQADEEGGLVLLLHRWH